MSFRTRSFDLPAADSFSSTVNYLPPVVTFVCSLVSSASRAVTRKLGIAHLQASCLCYDTASWWWIPVCLPACLLPFSNFWCFSISLFNLGELSCVFWGDLYGCEGENPQPAVAQLEDLIRARTLFGYGETRDYWDHANCVGWVRVGDKSHDGCAVVICNGDEDGYVTSMFRTCLSFLTVSDHLSGWSACISERGVWFRRLRIVLVDKLGFLGSRRRKLDRPSRMAQWGGRHWRGRLGGLYFLCQKCQHLDENRRKRKVRIRPVEVSFWSASNIKRVCMYNTSHWW